MPRTLSLRLAAFAAVAWLFFTPSSAQAQKALVYCPVGVDATGCNAIVAALGADASLFPDGVEGGYDGSSGTVDLAAADLTAYAVLVIPSLADGQGVTPYALLRNGTIAGRIGAAFVGRTAVWSGTPDVGSTNRAAKDALIRNLAGWAKADAAGTHGPGLVALQDNSDIAAARYGWVGALSALAIAPDTTLEVYSNVQVLTSTGRTILTNASGLQIGYTNMASYGLIRGTGGSDEATGGRTSRVVLVTMAGESDPNIATVHTDKEDYAPGETVTITGTGWEPGETVAMQLHEDPLVHGDRTLSAVADENGRILNDAFSPEEHDIGVRFVLSAAGQTSGRTAQTTFTDGITKVTGSPIGLTFNVPWTLYTNSLCTTLKTGGGGNSGTAALTPAKTTDNAGNAGQNEFQKLSAPATTAEGGSFKHWIRPDGTTTTTNPLCAPGDQATPTYTAVYSASNLTIDKAHSGNFVRGATGDYSLSVTNTGDAATSGTITVLDTLPTGLSFSSFNGTNWNCVAAASPARVTCTYSNSVAPGNSASLLTLTLSVANNAAASITNTAWVSGGGEPAANNGNNSDSDPTTTVNAVNLAIDKAHTGTFIKGSNGVFTMAARNDGGAPTSGTVTVTDVLPSGFGFVSASGGPDWTCNFAAPTTTVTCTSSTAIPAGASAAAITLTVSVNGTVGATVTNTASVSGGNEPAANNGNNSDSDAIVIAGQPDLVITKSHTGDFTEGVDGTYTLQVSNSGTGVTSGTVTVTDVLPNGLGTASGAGTGWSCSFDVPSKTLTCTSTTAINAGANASAITMTVSVLASAVPAVTNTASVSGGNEPAANNGNNSDSDPTNVEAANQAPVAVADAANTNEDNAVEIDVLANDTDDGAAANLVVASVTQPAAGTGSVALSSGNKKVTYTPPADFSGTATFTYKASDGSKQSANATVTVTVNPVNDQPTFTKGADQTVDEDAGAQTATGWATNIKKGPANESGQTLTFTLTPDNPALFAAGPAINPATGTLTFTPADDAFGTTSVTVRLSDNGGTANGGVDFSEQTFSITITPVNDAPSFTKGADQEANEDGGAQTVTGWATAISAGPGESGQVLTFQITNNTTPSLFAVGPAVSASGTLTYTPAANANGEATITLRLKDDGGTANGGVDVSPTQTFKITVNPVNDAPTFTKGANQTVLEDAGAQTVANWASNFSAGPPNESEQILSIATTNDNNALFSAQPSVALNGTLTYTPAANAFGSATVTVKLSDDGGTANGGVDFSAQTFTITVTPVNDAPSFTKGADQTVNEDAGAQTVAGWATAITAGPNEDATQTVSFTVTNNSAGLFSSAPAVASNGALTYTPAANANGSALVTVVAKDDGGIVNDGVDQSAAQTFTITVRAVNDAPSFTKGADVTINESGNTYTATGWATAISKGPADESGQTLQFIITADATRFAASGYPSIDPATGTLTFRAKSTPNTPISISVALKDNGGVAYGGVDQSAAQTFTITVDNVPPSALAVTLPSAPVPISNAAAVTIGFTDPGLEDVHKVTVNWGDAAAPTTQTLTVGTRSNQQSHTYSQPNVYVVTVTVDDGDGGIITDTFEYIVIYDPDGGFVTGGGTIYSPAGAFRTAPTLEGRANFGFVSKYLKNASVPTGSTEFQFQAGDLNFKSTNYEWLVVSGTKGQYRGFGTINGGGNYRFVLTVNDGVPDQFRIRIWSDAASDDGNGSIVYDNQLADPTDAFTNAKAAIATGSIVVHAPNGKVASK